MPMDCPDYVKLDCEYCAKVERKNSKESEKATARIVFGGTNLEEQHKEQEEDPVISFILRGKQAEVRPPRTETPSGNVSAQLY